MSAYEQFDDDELSRWRDEALELEDAYRDKMLFWKRLRSRLEVELEARRDRAGAVAAAEELIGRKGRDDV